jgi:AcrR family transcriptional regulator
MAATPHLRSDARRNRERIIAAATALVASRGVDCQMAEIARAAGVGNATVFRNFPTKRDLLVAVVEARMEEMLEVARAAEALDDPEEALLHLVGGIARLHVADAGLKRVAAQHFLGDERLQARRDEVLAGLARLVARAREAGVLRADVEPIDLVVLVNGVALAVEGLEEAMPGLHRRYLALAFAGLRPDAAAAGGPLPSAAPSTDALEAAWKRQAERGAGGC